MSEIGTEREVCFLMYPIRGTGVNQHNMGLIVFMVGNQMENVTILSSEHSLTVKLTIFL